MVEKQVEAKPEEIGKLEFKLSATVTALVDAVEDMSGYRPVLGVVHLEKGKAVVTDGFALVQVEDEKILSEVEPTRVIDVPLSVIKPHCKKEVSVTVSGEGTSTVSVARALKRGARETRDVIYKTETQLPATNYPEVTHFVETALGNTYLACIAFDASKISTLLRFLSSLQSLQKTSASRITRLYVPTNPTEPLLLTMSDGTGDHGNVKALLMPMFVDWSGDGIKKVRAETIKYEEEKHGT